MFSFLIDLTLSKNEIQKNVELLMDSHPKDVDLKLTDELFHFHLYVRQNHKPTDMHCVSHLDLYQIIHKENIEMAFPNVELILRMFLSLMVTNCSGERSFSKLNRIKSELRSNMSQERLSALRILYIESDTLSKINLKELIDDFAIKKSRFFF